MSLKALELGGKLLTGLDSSSLGKSHSINSILSKGLPFVAEVAVSTLTASALGGLSPLAGMVAGKMVEKSIEAVKQIGSAILNLHSVKDFQDAIQNTAIKTFSPHPK